MPGKRIAVVSADRLHVNEHFGRAREFLIYDLEYNGTAIICE